MSRSHEGTPSNPENSSEQPEAKIERIQVSLDLTVNKALMSERADNHHLQSEQHVEGEMDTLLAALINELSRANDSLKFNKENPVYRRGEKNIDEEKTQQMIAYNERSIENLKSLIQKLRAFIEHSY